MKTALCMNCMNVTHDSKPGDFANDCFMVRDIADILMELKIEATIVNIGFYCGEQEEKEAMLRKICSGMHSVNGGGEIVICTSAFVSTVEFPSDKWYDPNVPLSNGKTEGRKAIPFDDILDRESEMLEKIGFVSINDFVGYKTRKAFIYLNDIGKKVLTFSID
ncbi:hypothetical protein D7V86_01420 [bacterium D16-51]|nr:hypothetical protein D7V96_03900 [bacterium D16-59]RKI62887.1 hypothetical protein D7V86_01420 [bacterium D16-51]